MTKISCLLVTFGDPARTPMLERSVAAFCAQTFEDKELVIVSDGPRTGVDAIEAFIESLDRSDVRLVRFDERLSLGALRNRSCESASGDLFCQWDDDDIYHPRRLEEQHRALVDAGAACLYLEDTLQFFAASREVYWLNWRATEARAHPGTLLCRRSSQPRYPESGDMAERGEDYVVCLELQRKPGFATLAQMPYLYVYVTHDVNKYPREHHAMLAGSLAISRGLLERREAMLRDELASLDFGSGKVVVQGSNGPAFALNESVSS
jgi:glycosyltransferase involved in cell wall biosynthesis